MSTKYIINNSDLSLPSQEINADLNVVGSISATTFYGDGSNLTGISTQNTFVTGGTYSAGTATFTNNTGGTFSVTGFTTGTTTNDRVFQDLTINNQFDGDIIKIGSGTTTPGLIYYLKNDNSWVLANASAVTTSNGFICVATGTDPLVDGMLIYGLGNNVNFTGTTGSPLYLTTTSGMISEDPPSGIGFVIRVVGYKLSNTNSILFKPDPTWIELN